MKRAILVCLLTIFWERSLLSLAKEKAEFSDQNFISTTKPEENPKAPNGKDQRKKQKDQSKKESLQTLISHLKKYNFSIESDEIFEENLFHFYNNKINLNATSEEELKSLGILSSNQINELFNHIRQNGSLMNIYELQVLESYDSEIIHILTHFCYVRETLINKYSKRADHIRGYILTRYKYKFVESDHYFKSDKLGSPDLLVTKFKIDYLNRYEIAFSAKKGPGEEYIIHNNTKRYIYNSFQGYFALKNISIIHRLICGDFQNNSGQGMMFSSNFLTKGKKIQSISNAGDEEITGYSSLARDNSFRGVGLQIQNSRASTTLFFSIKNIDAIIKSENKNMYFKPSKFLSYNTVNNLRKKGIIKEKIIGNTTSYKTQYFHIGLNTLIAAYKLDKDRLEKYSQIFDNVESRNFINKNTDINTLYYSDIYILNNSIFLDSSFKNINLFSECGISHISQGYTDGAAIVGGLVSFGKRFDMSTAVRIYGGQFRSVKGNPYRETSGITGERGVAYGIRYSPFSKLSFETILDIFQIYDKKLEINKNGYSLKFATLLSPSRKQLLEFVFKNKQKETFNSKDILLIPNKIGFDIKYRWPVTDELTHKISSGINTFTEDDKSILGQYLSTFFKYNLSKIAVDLGIVIYRNGASQNRFYVYTPIFLYDSMMPKQFVGTGQKMITKFVVKKLLGFRLELLYEFIYHKKKNPYKSKLPIRIFAHEVGLQLMYRLD